MSQTVTFPLSPIKGNRPFPHSAPVNTQWKKVEISVDNLKQITLFCEQKTLVSAFVHRNAEKPYYNR